MFDSAFADWRPGKPVLFGWPWHGRLDMRKDAGGARPRLTLPNGTLIRLDWSTNLPGVLAAHQPGNLLLFRDPRAAPVERSDEQLAGDSQAGREWRAAALYNPRESIIYGQQYELSDELGMARWIYHDGEQNWQASVNNQLSSVRLIPGARLTRRARGSRRDVPIAMPGGAPASDAGYDWVVVDAMPAGNRCILARVSTEMSAVPAGGYSKTDGEGWRWLPVEFWELTLTSADGVHGAILTQLRSQTDTAGAVIARQVPDLPDHAIGVLTEWTQGGPVGDSGVYNWTGNIVAVATQPDGSGGYGTRVPEFGNYSINYGIRNAVLSLYYRPDGTVAGVLIDIDVHESYSGDIDGNVSGTGAITATPINGYPGTDWAPSAAGIGSGSFSATRRWDVSCQCKILNDGLTVETAELTSSGSTTISVDVVYQIPGALLSEPSWDTSIRSLDQSCSWSLTLDGAFDAGESKFSNQGAGTNIYSGPWAGGSALTYGARSINIVPATAFNSAAPVITLGSVRYCAQMPCLFALRTSASEMPTAPEKVRIGGGSLPIQGGMFSGHRDLYGVIPELFGSYNPITRQYIRDAENPVCWL